MDNPDFVLLTGDQVLFTPVFGPAIVVVQPGILRGTSMLSLGPKAICVVGDENLVSVPGCVYTTPQFSIPGVGTLSIATLNDSHRSKHTSFSGKRFLLKGNQFVAKFVVNNPARQPIPAGAPIPDSTPFYMGSGTFVTTNSLFKTA